MRGVGHGISIRSPMFQHEGMAPFMDDFNTQSNSWFQLVGPIFVS